MSAFYYYLIFEELLKMNPVAPFRKIYVRNYKDDANDPGRKLLTVARAPYHTQPELK
jgi:hypothetical protein